MVAVSCGIKEAFEACVKIIMIEFASGHLRVVIPIYFFFWNNFDDFVNSFILVNRVSMKI